MNRRLLAAFVVSLCLALAFVPVFSASSSAPVSVSVNHYYAITAYGYGVLNDTFTFKNNGTSAAQIPPIQVGLPSQIASRATGVVLSPAGQYSLSQAQSNGSTIFTITPNQPTLQSGASATVAMKTILTNILNYSNGAFATSGQTLVLLSPSLSMNVTQMKSSIVLPGSGSFAQPPSGFIAPASNSTSPTYTLTQTNIQPQASAPYLNFTDANQAAFTPIAVNGLIRTIVPAANGTPQVQDEFSIQNLASYNINQVKLFLLNTSPSTITVVPNTVPPLMNPTLLSLGGGELVFANTPLASPLLAESNVSLTVSYPLPSSLMTVDGSNVKIVVPFTPMIAAPVNNYTIVLAPAKGVSPTNGTVIKDKSVTPLTQGSASFSYSVNIGWAADQAVPAAALIFAVAFALFAIQKPRSEGEEVERKERNISDVLEAFEEKTGLETQYIGELASKPKGSVSRASFERMKNEVSELRGRAIQRLTEMKQDLGPGKQFDSLTRVAEAEREEDRAFRDLLNLYSQYHGNRMNEETFRKLLPNYKRRVDTAINKLSDLLHETQSEEK
ncbi:MAG: hypothetical protein OK455_07065 [Thaumarchaeota archaeon]|nr:hypothetical protein [Nitrososphaerota archaeon]